MSPNSALNLRLKTNAKATFDATFVKLVISSGERGAFKQ